MTDVMRQSGQAARGGGNRDVMRRKRKETFYLKKTSSIKTSRGDGKIKELLKGQIHGMKKKRNLLFKIDELSVVE